MELTVFEDVKAQTAHPWERSFEELAGYLSNPPEYPTKQLCPLFTGVTFGDRRTAAGSFRSDDNAVSIDAAIGDYDGGELSVADAQAILSYVGIKAIIYTSASHTEDCPRWRVIAPLSVAYYPAAYREFVGRTNAALGGILARESFTLSQSYYFRRVTGAAYECVVSEGQCVDLVEIEPQNPAPVATKPFHVISNVVSDETIEELRSALAAIPSDERPVWIEVGQALKPLGDEVGYELWEEWSAKSDKHDSERDRRTWDGLSGDRTGYQAVFAKAQRLGWVNPLKRKHRKLDPMFFDGQKNEIPCEKKLIMDVENFSLDGKFPNNVANVSNVATFDLSKAILLIWRLWIAWSGPEYCFPLPFWRQ